MEIRQANCSDIETLMEIFEGAKEIMRSSGNLQQWNGAYPTVDVVRKDIEDGNCYVLCDSEQILGTMALIPGPDPTYSYIEGAWPDEDKYYVIHRIATGLPGRNIARRMFDWAFEHISAQGYRVIRIDTHSDNCIMKHILSKYGFQMCGIIYLQDGAPRDAYHLHK
jgi:L-amino acid N-acyltransferase YncA